MHTLVSAEMEDDHGDQWDEEMVDELEDEELQQALLLSMMEVSCRCRVHALLLRPPVKSTRRPCCLAGTTGGRTRWLRNLQRPLPADLWRD